MCLPNILFPVFMFAITFPCRSFSPCWPLAFLIFSPPLWISMCFFLRNSSPFFSITRSSSFSVIRVSVNIKNNAEKDTTFLLLFLSKSPSGHVLDLFGWLNVVPNSYLPGKRFFVCCICITMWFTSKWYGNSWNKTFYSQRVWIGYNIELAE